MMSSLWPARARSCAHMRRVSAAAEPSGGAGRARHCGRSRSPAPHLPGRSIGRRCGRETPPTLRGCACRRTCRPRPSPADWCPCRGTSRRTPPAPGSARAGARIQPPDQQIYMQPDRVEPPVQRVRRPRSTTDKDRGPRQPRHHRAERPHARVGPFAKKTRQNRLITSIASLIRAGSAAT